MVYVAKCLAKVAKGYKLHQTASGKWLEVRHLKDSRNLKHKLTQPLRTDENSSLSSVQLFLCFGPLGLWRARLSWQPRRLRLGVFVLLATGPPFNRVYVSGGDLQQLFQFGTIRPSSTHPRKTLESAMVPSCQWLWIMDPRSAIIGQRGRGEENLCLVSRWNRKNPKSTQNFMHFPRLSA